MIVGRSVRVDMSGLATSATTFSSDGTSGSGLFSKPEWWALAAIGQGQAGGAGLIAQVVGEVKFAAVVVLRPRSDSAGDRCAGFDRLAS